jgi:hypothetical protein
MPNMQNAWDPGGLHRYAAIDLGAAYKLSNIYVWDRDGALAAGKVLAVYAHTSSSQPSLNAGSMSGQQVQSMLAGSAWQRIAWYDFASWESWVEVVVDVQTRYLVLGFEDGPSTFFDNPWPRDWLPVPELVLKGALISPAPALIARPTSSTVLVNGKSVAFDAYNINGNNYFKLRDLAFSLSGSQKQFEVAWDSANNKITLTSARPYSAVGGEMAGKGSGNKTPLPTSSSIYLDGKAVAFTAYNIDGNNYFKLRDIGAAFDFGVDWDGAKNTIVIDTSKGYSPD